MRRPFLLMAAALGLLAATAGPASALPGDAPITLLSPGPDVVLEANPQGIGVTYACPVYRQTDAGGGFVFFGKWSDYGIAVATSPDVGADGRLLQDRILATDGGHQPNTLPADQCAGTLGTGRADGPENTPGTYWWQAYRITSAGYDVSEVRSFTIRSTAKPRVASPGPVFGGYPVVVPLRAAGVADGVPVTLQRKAGPGWRTLGAGRAFNGSAEAIATLPAGRQTLRALVQGVASPHLAVTVKPPSSRRVTSAADDGAYRGGKLSTSFRIAGGGRTITGFRATVTMVCPQIPLPGGQGQIGTRAGFAQFRSARLAPDGRFVVATTRQGSAVLVRGRVKGGRLTGGIAQLSVGTCTGSGTFTATKR